MPYECSWEPHGVVKRFWGMLSGFELATSVEAIAAHPDFDNLHYIINDFREVDCHRIDHTSVERIAVARLGSMATNPNIRVLVICSDPTLIASMDAAASDALLRDTYETRRFETMEQCRSWLSRQPALHNPPRRFG